MTRILVIDDSDRAEEHYRALLAAEDWQLLIFAEGAEALKRAGDATPPIDLAIVLWELGGEVKGGELLIRLRRAQPQLPVIVVSGSLDWSRASTARQLGATDFLLKPFEKRRLHEAVQAAMAAEANSPLVNELSRRIIGHSPGLLAVLKNLAKVIVQGAESVLLVGASGTGKELLAKAFHELGEAAGGPWVPVNVAAIAPTLLETHLFGHEPGAFTDAKKLQVGCFEESGGGVLFLDEIGELDRTLQTKLLRVIQERTFRRVGGTKDLDFTGRLVCATNRNLVADVKGQRFREDLYYRIATHEIRVPSLRERGPDLWRLMDHFLAKHAKDRKVRLARETKELLGKYSFPGNVRELEDILRHALFECRGEEVLPYHLPVKVMEERQVQPTVAGDLENLPWPERLFAQPHREALEEIENAFNRRYLPRILAEANHKIKRAAEAAGWKDDRTLREKLKKCGLGLSGDRR